MKIVQILIKVPPVNSEVLVDLKNIESPDICGVVLCIIHKHIRFLFQMLSQLPTRSLLSGALLRIMN
jgi:hypothetical protein